MIRLSRLLAEEPDPHRELVRLIEGLRAELTLDRAAVFAWDRARGAELITSSPAGAGEEPPSAPGSPPDPHRAVAIGELPRYVSADGSQGYPSLNPDSGVAILPIAAGGQVLGTLWVDNGRSRQPVSAAALEALDYYVGLAAHPLLRLGRRGEVPSVRALQLEIVRDVLLAGSSGTTVLCDGPEMDAEWPMPAGGLPVAAEEDIPRIRAEARAAALRAGMSEDRAWSFGLCAAEAAANALLHGSGGQVTLGGTDALLRARVTDSGGGIELGDIPTAILRGGLPSAPTVGMGFTIMGQTADRVLLHTDPGGTSLILEMSIRPREESEDAWSLLAQLDTPPL